MINVSMEPLSSIPWENILHEETIKVRRNDWKLRISSLNLYLIEPKQEHKFNWQDVIGAKIQPKTKQKKILILCFPIINNTRRLIKHQIVSEDPEKLVKIIQSMAYHGIMPDIFNQTYIKRFSVLINPNSGRSLSRRVWSQVSELFEVCEVSVTETGHRNHATQIVTELNLADYDGILVVSGDGMVHEVINALCKREDGDLARMFPVGVIPAGSANALSQVVCDKSGEPVSPEICSFIAIKGTTSPFDISLVKFESGSVVYSFLSVFWALIADIDIESETCRCCGACRFDLYGFWRVLALRRYNGTISWNEGQYTGPVVYFMACNTPYIGEGMNTAPKSQYDDGMNDLMFLGNVGRMALIRVLLRQDSGAHVNSPHLQYIKTKNWSLDPGVRKGIFSIDGELYQAEPINVEVLHNYCTVFILPLS